ncbi:MAG: hypothetical protein ABEH77_07470 [Halobacteriaceae archaeon]
MSDAALESRGDPDADTNVEVRDARITFGMERGTSRVPDDVTLDIRRGVDK